MNQPPPPESSTPEPSQTDERHEDDAGLPVPTARAFEAGSIAADRSRPLFERLEAIEDFIESEVGDTTMARARNIERETDLRQLHLKFEGSNPTGTHKDRIAFAQVADALRRGFDVVSAATCGNYGSAIALAAKLAGIDCHIYVPMRNHSKRLAEIEGNGAKVVRVDGDYETAVAFSSSEAQRLEFYDANPGGANTSLQLKAYGEIAFEIYDELRDAPAAVAAPLSNGTLVAGLFRGFQSLHRRGKISRMPRIIGGSARGQNPIVRGFLSGASECPTLPPTAMRETETNEPLINWYSIDGDLALDALRQSGGHAGEVSDRAMQQWARRLRDNEGLSVLPAATAGLAALLDLHTKTPLPQDRYVAVLTARR
jgi:threonine synthase